MLELTYLQKYNPHIKEVRLGQKLFMPFRRGMIIPVTVIGIIDFLHMPDEESTCVVERYVVDDGTCPLLAGTSSVSVYVRGEEASESGMISQEQFDTFTLSSRFLDVDEVVGHHVSIGDEVRETLEEARRATFPVGKNKARGAAKKLQIWRQKMTNWIQSMHNNCEPLDSSLKCPLITSEKPVYIRKGKYSKGR